MTIVIASENQDLFKAYFNLTNAESHQLIWVGTVNEFADYAAADAFIDLNGTEPIHHFAEKPLLINNVTRTLDSMFPGDGNVARFCGWVGFVERTEWELALPANANEQPWQEILQAFGKDYMVVKDIPGLIAPRILSMIINEACYTLEECISDAEQVDIAMRLGTNYPDGPITWGKKIGAPGIIQLMKALAGQDSRYLPHPSMEKILS